jgi:hypothetical protein
VENRVPETTQIFAARRPGPDMCEHHIFLWNLAPEVTPILRFDDVHGWHAPYLDKSVHEFIARFSGIAHETLRVSLALAPATLS